MKIYTSWLKFIATSCLLQDWSVELQGLYKLKKTYKMPISVNGVQVCHARDD